MSIRFFSGKIWTFPKNEHKNPKQNGTSAKNNKGSVNTCNAIRCCYGGTSENALIYSKKAKVPTSQHQRHYGCFYKKCTTTSAVLSPLANTCIRLLLLRDAAFKARCLESLTFLYGLALEPFSLSGIRHIPSISSYLSVFLCFCLYKSQVLSIFLICLIHLLSGPKSIKGKPGWLKKRYPMQLLPSPTVTNMYHICKAPQHWMIVSPRTCSQSSMALSLWLLQCWKLNKQESFSYHWTDTVVKLYFHRNVYI